MLKRLTETRIANLEQKAQQANGQKHVTVYGFVSPETKQLVKSINRINGEWVETDEPPTMLLAEKLERAVVSDKRFIVIVGGRGSAKSVGVIDIMLAGVMDYGDKVYCLREFQTSIKQSIHSLNVEEIKRLQLEGFRCQEAAIYHESGGEFQYAGIKQNPDSIKSAAGFRRYMCEESGSLSEKSITTLTPTARNKAKAGLPGELIEAADELEGVQIWFVANPQASNDPFSKRFITPFIGDLDSQGYYEDDLHLIIKMNYEDNPWFDDSGLDTERLFDYENKSRALYDHVWRGAFLDTVENSIIDAAWFDACIDAHEKLGWKAEGQEKMAFDPADSGDAKAVAYQVGTVIMGVKQTELGDVNDATDWALGMSAKLKPDVFIWDSTGIGIPLKRDISHALEGKKIKAVPFYSSGGAVDPSYEYEAIDGEIWEVGKEKTNGDLFANLRAQMYWRLRDRIFKTYLAVEKGRYYSPDELISFSSAISELTALRSEICRIPRKMGVASGKIQILDKAAMKSLGIKSPNMADAVMMLQLPVDVFGGYDDDYEPVRTSSGEWA